VGGCGVDCCGFGQKQVAEISNTVMNFHVNTNLNLLIPLRCEW